MTNIKQYRQCALLLLCAVELSVCGLAQQPAQSKTAAANSSKWTEQQKAAMAERVRQDFLHAWGGYKQYAWGHDELRPLTKGYRDWYASSLLMTPVDALDTMVLMGLKDEANADRELIDKQLSFDKDIYVKNFEITIRLLGGLLSSYQLTGDKRLLELADDLGTRLLPAFNSPTGMPYVFVNLKTGATKGVESNPAEIGSLLIEFGTLGAPGSASRFITTRPSWALLAVYDRRSPIGLVGSSINVETGKWTNPVSHISGGIDSYYEYLLACSILFAGPRLRARCEEPASLALNSTSIRSALADCGMRR